MNMDSKFIPVGLVRRTPHGLAVEGAGLAAMPDFAIMFAQVPDDGSRLLMQERAAIAHLLAVGRQESDVDAAGAIELAIAVIRASRRKLDLYTSSVGVLKAALETSEALRYAQEDTIANIAQAARDEAFAQVVKYVADAPFGGYTAEQIAAGVEQIKAGK